jgi:hypothetical protein
VYLCSEYRGKQSIDELLILQNSITCLTFSDYCKMPFIDCLSGEWNEFLKNCNYDIYHLPGYTQLDAELNGGYPLGWISYTHNTHCLIPLIKREIPLFPGCYDLTSTYGYPAMLSPSPLSEIESAEAWRTFNIDATNNGYISSFIRMNPLQNNPHTGFQQTLHGHTLSVDLKKIDNGDTVFSLNHRRDLRKLSELNLSVVTGRFEYMPAFIRAYTQTMLRNRAKSRYFFPLEYFRKLISVTDHHLIFISVLMANGEFICGGLFTIYGTIMQYHLGATSTNAVRLSPSKLMLREAMKVGLSSGATTLHLGGGYGSNDHDGVFRFKKGFSTNIHPFNCIHIIHRPDVYNQIMSKTRHATIEEHTSVYFPKYRDCEK